MFKKISKAICSVALLFAPVTLAYCRFFFFQPEEPEGLQEFLKKDK
ncbi:MAG: cyclic lactone autoinducer peptide [Eubacterium sp.]|nr:cyclic lactone autoinducer peptide [Eubacterium sp.]